MLLVVRAAPEREIFRSGGRVESCVLVTVRLKPGQSPSLEVGLRPVTASKNEVTLVLEQQLAKPQNDFGNELARFAVYGYRCDEEAVLAGNVFACACGAESQRVKSARGWKRSRSIYIRGTGGISREMAEQFTPAHLPARQS